MGTWIGIWIGIGALGLPFCMSGLTCWVSGLMFGAWVDTVDVRVDVLASRLDLLASLFGILDV